RHHAGAQGAWVGAKSAVRQGFGGNSAMGEVDLVDACRVSGCTKCPIWQIAACEAPGTTVQIISAGRLASLAEQRAAITCLDDFSELSLSASGGTPVKILFVSRLERWVRAVRTITKYVELGQRLGHEVAVFGDPRGDLPSVPHSRDVSAFDFAIFVIYETADFPDLPHLAQLIDRMPKDRRIIIDCTGAYNKT